MKLRGRKVLINIPEVKKSLIEMTPEVQAELDKEILKKWTTLKVFAVGDLIEDIKVDDSVYITSSGLQSAERVEIDGEVKFLINDYNIDIIW